ncbi:tetratricopeptide repeat protein (plasmid) [Streptomyces sp. P9-2B-2]|uniref:tetratricopeptide repeat protein n=1 Tax=Streptomyces sp. P9-2B-2 TaxID=3057114 RepID=UPI0025B2D0D9|nr:tetratricopeptide repeat protein [Streptomyces sp. P9-2B-2]WJY43218.1 tetratricopeptide repeat protein [Streptomyces sp. P9-2B-2]
MFASGTVVLAGAAGTGKTQLAARYARTVQQARMVDLLVWVTASSREAIVTGYAQTGTDVTGADPGDPAQAATRFLTWTQTTDRRWLIVLDDLADPADLQGLWPVAQPGCRVLITTRRRDAALFGQKRRRVDVGLFTPAEATGYLAAKLAAQDRSDHPDQIAGLAADLGHLPLALSQAAAYLLDLHLDCAGYRTRLADRRRALADLAPENSGLPDDQRATVAASWSLSTEHADRLRPRGLARPLLQLASMLDPNGIPATVLTSPPALAYLTGHRTLWESADALDGHSLAASAEDAADALRCLHRLSLVDHTPNTPHQALRVHNLVQRATREALPRDQHDAVARSCAAALYSAWPQIERDTSLSHTLRANVDALTGHAPGVLWQPEGHPVLFRTGDSLTASGLVDATHAYWEGLLSSSRHHLGPDHPQTLDIRQRLANAQADSGDVGGAISAAFELLDDKVRVLGPDHRATLATRMTLASWRGESGDAAGAFTALGELLEVLLRVLGPDHRATLATRVVLARWRGESGDADGAVSAFAEVLADSLRVLGADHPDILTARQHLARWQGESGNEDGAVSLFTDLVEDLLRVLGPDHPSTLAARANLAYWRGQTGDLDGSVTAYTEVLEDFLRVLGPDHPSTLSARANLAHRRWEAGDVDGSVTAYTEVLDHSLRVLGPDHPNILTYRSMLAHWQRESDAEGALAALTHLVDDMLRVLGPDDVRTLEVRSSLGRWQGESGDVDGAVITYTVLVDGFLRVVGPDDVRTLEARAALGRYQLESGDADEAVITLIEHVDALLRVLGPDDVRTLEARTTLGLVQVHWGGSDEAVIAFTELVDDLLRVLGPDHPLTLEAQMILAQWRASE